jgi:hypothetical protein
MTCVKETWARTRAPSSIEEGRALQEVPAVGGGGGGGDDGGGGGCAVAQGAIRAVTFGRGGEGGGGG